MLSEAPQALLLSSVPPRSCFSRANSCKQLKKSLQTVSRGRLLFSVVLPGSFPKHFSQGKAIYQLLGGFLPLCTNDGAYPAL